MQGVLAELVDRYWPGRRVTAEPLEGGITNANYLLDVDGEQVVVRVPGRNTHLLGIDRLNEVEACRIAASVGIAPEIVLVDEVTGCVVTRFLTGRKVAMAELATEPMLGAVVAALKAVHGAGLVAAGFDTYRIIRGYAADATARGVAAPFDYRRAAEVLAAVQSVRPFAPAALCHNDLLNANLLYDGDVKILDWEYAGMGDPLFDLANFSVNNELGAALDGDLLRHYFDEVDDRLCSMLRLMKLVSELREAMWGVLQTAISDLDVDFETYAAERGERFFSLLAGMDLGAELSTAAGRPRR